MRVPHATDSAALVRHRISADLAGHGIAGESIDEVVLVINELVGNALRHTSALDGELDVEWNLDRTGVTVLVGDPSPDAPTPRRPDSTEPNGRGLRIVDALSDDWGVCPAGTGKRVWAHVPLRRRALSRT